MDFVLQYKFSVSIHGQFPSVEVGNQPAVESITRKRFIGEQRTGNDLGSYVFWQVVWCKQLVVECLCVARTSPITTG